MPIIGGRQVGVRGLGFQGAGRPSQVTGLTATDFGTNRAYNNGRIDLSWNTPASNGAPITGYRIERSTDGSSYSALVANTGSTSTTYSDTSLSSNQTYYYKVAAINAVDTGLLSAAASALSTTVPQAPYMFSAFVEDPPVSGRVEVQYQTAGTGGKSITTFTATSNPGGITGTTNGAIPLYVSGLTNGTSYTFTVTATNANGTSLPSSASNSVVPTLPGSFESIASFSPTSGDNVTFSSIPSTYKNLQLRIKYMTSSGNSGFSLQFNGITTNVYTTNILEGNGSTTTASFPYGGATSSLQIMAASNGTLPNVPNVVILDIIDYQSTTKQKTIRFVGGKDNNGNTTSSISWLGAGLWASTSAISSINLSGPTFIAGTEISLYGIKG